jgi:hypothetical protein
MSRVGEQRHGIAHYPVERFDDDEAEIECNPDGEGFAEARRRMGVRVAMIVMGMRVAAMIVGH